jgi:ureidoglycolate hydrolase
MVAVAAACAHARAFAPRVSRVSTESSGRRVSSPTPRVSLVGASRPSLPRPSARVRAASESSDTLESVVITAEPITPEAFAPFGQVISAEEDGAEFGPDDAQLDLSQGTPRFYIMRLRDKAMRFDRITYHGKVTQCLGALGDHSWYMAVAAPTMSIERRPSEGDIRVFEIPPGTYVKMHAGTWHAGPLWDSINAGPAHIDFYNLELSDTNVADHNTHDYAATEGIVFEVAAACAPSQR